MKKEQALLSASAEITVSFYDIDPMNIAWHGNYFRFFEHARCALMDKIDYNYPQMEASGYGWPIVDSRLKYIGPARLHQQIIVTANLVEFENRLKVNYVIRDKDTQQVLHKAHTTQVAVDMKTGEMQFRSPDVLFEKLAAVGIHVDAE